MIENINVFSHLRWSFVFQRPQQIITRVAKGRRVLFVEEPILSTDSEHWKKTDVPGSSIRVCTPCTPVEQPGFAEPQLPFLKRLMLRLIEEEEPTSYALWFYTPMALPVAEGLKPVGIVYDC